MLNNFKKNELPLFEKYMNNEEIEKFQATITKLLKELSVKAHEHSSNRKKAKLYSKEFDK